MKFSPLLALLLASPVFAADPRGDNPDAAPSTPQEQLAKFTVPPGFEVQLVADETQIQKPMNLNFDAAGRLWVTGSALYPWPAKVDALGQPIAGFDEVWKNTAGSFDASKAPAPPEQAIDTVRVLSNFGPDGRARKVQVFADGLNIPIGVLPLPRKSGAKGDTVIVFSIPTIWRMEDTDGDGRADKKEALYTGFDFKDTHGMSSNYLYWIDGWIYGCHGFRNHSEVRDRAGRVTVFDSGNTYRFRPDGSQIEVYTHGQTNPFGLTVDPLGNFYSADSHSKPVMLLQRGGYYAGIGKNHDGLGFAPTITDDDHGSSAIAGLAYYADNKFPAEFRDNLFNGNPVTRRINRARLEWHGATPKAIRMPDFLTCDDPWFRPIQVKLGPDGVLYIADFYNPIIGHYEFPLADPRRDSKHGRLWRVVWRGTAGARPAPRLPNLTRLDAPALTEKLAHPNLTLRTLATHELVERVGKEALPALRKIIEPSPLKVNETAAQRAHALIALGRIADLKFGSDDYSLFNDARARGEELPRILTLKFAAEDHPWTDSDTDCIVSPFSTSASPMIKRAAWELLFRSPQSVLLDKPLELLREPDPQDIALVYQTKVALREYLAHPHALTNLDEEKAASSAGGGLILDALLAIPTSEAAEFLLTHLQRTKLTAARASEYLQHAALHLPKDKFGALFLLTQHLETAPLERKIAVADHLTSAAQRRGIPLPQELTAWTRRTLIEALASADAVTINRAIVATREMTWDGKIEPLRKIVLDPKAPGSRRNAALEAMMNQNAGRLTAIEILATASSTPLRRKAAELLGQESSPGQAPREGALRAGEEARAALMSALPTAPAELAVVIAASLAKTEAGSSALLDLIEQGRAAPALLRNKAIAPALEKHAQPLRDRFAALSKNLPAEDARLNAVIAERTKAYAKARPNPSRGGEIFRQQCTACHRFRNEGGNLAPNLDGVAARGAERLIEDILDPNRNVDPLFRQTTIETTDGETLIGANPRDQGDSLLLANLAGQEFTVAKDRIKKQHASAQSLMPPVFESALPAADLNDLLAYLLSPAADPRPASSL